MDNCETCDGSLDGPTLANVQDAIRRVKFSKSYAVGRPSALRKLDDLETLREQLEAQQP